MHWIIGVSLLLGSAAVAQAQTVALSVTNGYMTLRWTVSEPGSHDFVALYDGNPHRKGPNGYLTNQWQWASRASPHVTGTLKGFNYYVAYLAQACRTCERRITAVAGPYEMPDPTVALTVAPTGHLVLHWTASQPGKRDFVALYDGDPHTKGTNGYLTWQWQWATSGASYETGTPEGYHYWAAYIEEDAHGARRIRAVAAPDACLGGGGEPGAAYVRSLNQCLVARYGDQHASSAFGLSTQNSLTGRWIAQTPDVWGKNANVADTSNHARRIVADVRSLVAGARQFIDITTLTPYPDGDFEAGILAGLTDLAHAGHPVTVRILGGWPQSSIGEGVKSHLDAYATPLSRIATNKVSLYVGAQRSMPISWNHAKMVAVDGNVILLGGENLWTNDYLGSTPVHDLNVIIRGPAAYYGHQFANLVWQEVCTYGGTWRPWSWAAGEKMDHRNCLEMANVSRPVGTGAVDVLGAGRYGRMNDRTGASIQPSDYLMALTLSAAQHTIRVSQQSLGFSPGNIYWADGMRALARAVAAERDVYIVLSNDGAKGGSNPYSLASIRQTADKLRDFVATASGKSGSELRDLLCRRLHLAPLRFGPSAAWPGGVTFANHAKFFMVDDAVFYVGSANLYPSDLQEYGVFVSDSGAVTEMQTEYWNPLWTWSKQAAISGSGAPSCYFD